MLALLAPALAGLAGTLLVSRARGRAGAIGPSAGLLQAIAVGGLAAAGLVAMVLLRGGEAELPPLAVAGPAGCAVAALAFPLLIGERVLTTTPPALLPEAAELRSLLRIAVLGWLLCGILVIAIGFGVEPARYGINGLTLLGALVTAELGVRATARAFLPPPGDDAARGACRSLLAVMLLGGAPGGGVAGTVRNSIGIDFARSWALAFVVRAVPATAASLAVLVWALTGVVIVGTDQSAIEERFGQPLAVLAPGLHLVMPWPASHLRWLDDGVTHESTLAGGTKPPATRPPPADARSVPDANRLWSDVHPGERLFLIASSGGNDTQNFQTMDADVQLIWKVGASDADAMRFVYGVTDPERYLVAIAGRTLGSAFAGETLDALLGENRDVLAANLLRRIQAEADQAGLGIAVVAVVIEALHPPQGAASAFQGVQAAELNAQSSVAAARRQAIVSRVQAAQDATQLETAATVSAAETRATATATLTGFEADRMAARDGGVAFRLERYFEDLVPALSRAGLTLIDHRVPAAQAPTLDLRPLGAPGVPGRGGAE